MQSKPIWWDWITCVWHPSASEHLPGLKKTSGYQLFLVFTATAD